MMRNLLLLNLLLFLNTPKIFAEEPLMGATNAEFNFSFESLTLTEFQNEKMGLLGGSLLFALKDYPWLALGAASYGTLTGARGGFITLGAASDMRFPVSDSFATHAGLFVGAGGGHGGYQLQGGGLMLRGHMGLSYDSALGHLGMGLSQVTFPNGHVDSGQLYVSYAYDYQTLLADGWVEKEAAGAAQPWMAENRHEFALVSRLYDVPQGVKNAAGGKQYGRIGLVGVEWQHEVSDAMFVSIESEGAMSGQSNGYMQILLGAGAVYPLSDSLQLKLSASAGVAGGGSVATGGGLLADMGLALQGRLSEKLSVEAEAGWVDSVKSDFRARSYALKLQRSFATPQVIIGDELGLDQLQAYAAQHMRIRFVNQSYFRPAGTSLAWRTHHAQRNVNLLGFQGDYFINDVLFVSGQGIAAYEGQAGGYMTGLLGLGVAYPLSSLWRAEAELLAGAAGGGGLAVGGGLVWQANAGLAYSVTDDYSVLCQLGRMDAVKGEFSANVLSVSAAYAFSFFMK